MEMKFGDLLLKKLQVYIRILKLAKRPTREEFLKISKIAGAMMALVGLIGFFIYLLMAELPGAL